MTTLFLHPSSYELVLPLLLATILLTPHLCALFDQYARGRGPSPRCFSERASQTEGAMSRLWDISELVALVAGQLSRQDQASMACTCRLLRDIIAPLLWRTLGGPDSQRINNLLPSRLKDMVDYRFEPNLIKYAMRLEEEPDEWGRFQLYTPLVKAFELVLSQQEPSLIPTLQSLQALSKIVFPTLEILNIVIVDPPYPGAFIRCLLSASIHTVRLDIHESISSIPNRDTMATVIRTTGLLHLTKLQLTIGDPSLMSCIQIRDAIADAIKLQPRLRWLGVLDLEDRFLRPWSAASGLEDLIQITFRDSNAFDDPWSSNAFPMEIEPCRGFPALEYASLELDAETLPTALSAITSPHLRELELLLQPPDTSDTTMLLDGRLGGIQRFSNLTVLRITFVSFTAEWDDILPLLSCFRLKKLTLQGNQLSHALGNEELEAMARAWPYLTELEIMDMPRRRENQSRGASATPRVTLGGLTCLAKRCPSLRALSISVDARETEFSPVPEVVGTAMEDLRLPLSRSSPGSCEWVADVIATTWPNQRMPSPASLDQWLLSRTQVGTFGLSTSPEAVRSWHYIWVVVYLSMTSSPSPTRPSQH